MTETSFFPASDNKTSINNQEKNTLKFWQDQKIFEKTITSRNEDEKFVFFDGPPFATGLPHYGHILAGTLKDAIPRYKTMQGYRVDRKWGWDCHGVPVEFLVEKEKKIGGKPGIEKMGVDVFNEHCRDAVMRCADSWEETVGRMGRFVDFKNDYKTMDPEFMESVWWVFGELWKKGLIYEGEKVVPYSPKLGSPLSNFEAGQNYQDIDDPAVTVKFPLKNPEKISPELASKTVNILAWTTTPWTMPTHLMLCVNPQNNYVLAEKDGEFFVIGEKLVTKLLGEDAEILENFTGEKLVGLNYEPPFNFFSDHKNAFNITADDFVGDSDGTGIVHLAPTGEDDARILQREDVKLFYPYDENGYFDDTIPELSGKYFRFDPEVESSKEDNANIWVLDALKNSGKLFKREQIRHSYPHCWRTDCALMYRGIKTWFVNVRKIKDLMIEKNQEINWLPEHLKDGRFGKILENAPDWAISRNRYWGAPIPVWRGEKTGKCVVITSRKQLEEKTGKPVTDLHKHFVDDLTWEEEGEKFVRIPEVLDCWFESGAMPYASVHYPFFEGEEKSDFLPADFIAEGLDQTRGWFYTLHVLGCALFGKNIYKNVITNGIVLAEDGQKMSKSKQNYPDPNLIFEKYGADAMRYYLLSSPVVRAENLRFSEKGVEEILKSVILPLKSTYQFFSTYANIDSWKPTQFTFVRHGEGTHNVQNIFSGKIENPHPLTEKGKAQVKATAERLTTPDILVASPFIRTQETAEILKEITQFTGDIITDDRVREVCFGEFDGVCAEDPAHYPQERIRKGQGEIPDEIKARVQDFISEYTQKFPGKNIMVASHGGPIRSAEAVNLGIDVNDLKTYFRLPQVQTGTEKVIFPDPKPHTELDRWILGELQLLLANYREKMDAYKLDEALRDIPKFIDNLNNWYLRRSRGRFWAGAPGEISEAKKSGYETLHYVLVNIAKILAPITPFFAEKLWQDLTGNANRSVHLEFLPKFQEKFIDKNLSEKISLIREITSLSAGIRARGKVKLRQPLGKLSFAVSSVETKNLLALQKSDLEIIAEEANVKSVEILSAEDVEKFAQKIVKVDARKVGRKFGKKMQGIIQAGKSGDYKNLENGRLEISGEILEADEYEVGFITEEGLEADSTSRTVVILDTKITEDLRREGISREIIRSIQDLRKSSGFEVSDRISVQFSTESADLKKVMEIFGEKIAGEVLAVEVLEGSNEGEIVKIEGEEMRMFLEKNH